MTNRSIVWVLLGGGVLGLFLLTSAAFSAVHQSPEAIVPIYFVGLVLNWIYEKTGSLFYPILFHALFNSTVLVYRFLVSPTA